MSAERPPPAMRQAFRYFVGVTPRWNDIDVFGHVNNAEFYAYFDSAVLRLLHETGAVAAVGGAFATLVVESGARFHHEVLFTDAVQVGIAIGRVGTSSVRYELAVFRNDDPQAAVEGHFVHVFVDRLTRHPTPIAEHVRQAFLALRPALEAQAS